MPNLCNITLAGHLGRDAETKTVSDQTVVEWSMAFTSKAKDKETTTWFKCAMWGSRATKVAQYLTKGKAVLVIGGMTSREYQAKDGTTKTEWAVRVESLTLLGGKEGERAEQSARPVASPAPAPSGGGSDSDPPFQRKGEWE
jgi:single-strand DNA-binding protein